MKTLQVDSYKYKPEEDYKSIQIIRHGRKKSNKTDANEYKKAFTFAEPFLLNKNLAMVCMGTRNNHERDCFKKYLPSFKVFSLDISPAAGADFTEDFNNLPLSYKDNWDVIYTNSLDHAIDAGATLIHWLSLSKENGMIIWHTNLIYDVVNDTDPCVFSYDKSISFFKENNIVVLKEESSNLNNVLFLLTRKEK